MLRFVRRLRARHRLATDVGLWYHGDYAAPRFARAHGIPGIEAFRGELILGQLVIEGLVGAGEVRAPRPASLRTLSLVHPQSYLESVTRPEVLAHIFGLDTEVVDVDALLSAARRAVGGTIAAAVTAARRGLRVAVNLGGGFHHAEPEMGSGFCVYNDVAVAVRVLRNLGYEGKVAVVDLDYHQGNGNIAAFADDPSVLTYSLHASVWTETDAVANVEVLVPPASGNAAYLEHLDATLPDALARHGPSLVFFLAGNDVLGTDKIGDLRLTPRGVLERDRRVLSLVDGLDAHMVVTLAGGYSKAAWECSTNLVRYLLTGVARAEHERPPISLRHLYHRVARALDPYELQREPEEGLELTADDILADLGQNPPARRFLDYYSLQGIEYALERYRLFDRLREKGFVDVRLEGDFKDRFRQVLRIHARAKNDPAKTFHLLTELVARRAEVPAPPGLDPKGPLSVLWVEWLLLQDPTRTFTKDRPPLPGQQYPGLGIAQETMEALLQICFRLGLDALLHRPAHYHNALVGARYFRFLDPEAEGRFEAMRRILAGYPLDKATSLVEEGRLALGDGTALPWSPADFALPVSDRVKRYLSARAYQAAAGEASRALLDAGLHVSEHPKPTAAEKQPA